MTRRRMLTVFYEPETGEVLECKFHDEWLTGGSLLRLDTLIDLSEAIAQLREMERGIWAAEWEQQRKGHRDVH
jgi:hypothetical protein